MAEHVISSMEQLYQAVVEHLGDAAPDQIAVVGGDGEATVYPPTPPAG